MDFKKTNAPTTTVTRDLVDFVKDTGNIYESVAIMGKRANQISVEMKEELKSKLEEFSSSTDNLEEMFENREQIEISRYYERLPKPTLIAAQEFEEGKIFGNDFIIVDGDVCFGAFFDCGAPVTFDIGYTEHDRLTVTLSENNYVLYIIEGDSSSAMWALGLILIVILAVGVFELLLSGFRNFVLQKRLLVFMMLLTVGYYILFAVYVLLVKGESAFGPRIGAALPLISLVLEYMAINGVSKAEAAIIARASGFRLRD